MSVTASIQLFMCSALYERTKPKQDGRNRNTNKELELERVFGKLLEEDVDEEGIEAEPLDWEGAEDCGGGEEGEGIRVMFAEIVPSPDPCSIVLDPAVKIASVQIFIRAFSSIKGIVLPKFPPSRLQSRPSLALLRACLSPGRRLALLNSGKLIFSLDAFMELLARSNSLSGTPLPKVTSETKEKRLWSWSWSSGTSTTAPFKEAPSRNDLKRKRRERREKRKRDTTSPSKEHGPGEAKPSEEGIKPPAKKEVPLGELGPGEVLKTLPSSENVLLETPQEVRTPSPLTDAVVKELIQKNLPRSRQPTLLQLQLSLHPPRRVCRRLLLGIFRLVLAKYQC
ncbi:hypothetical protein KSP40_PGU011419 [Platanthera guangdongensis]|uniref:Uncharacterized protein n=1 Tax=Platanthera guangdongensis TaxID=2320717 RepID=A0ABR2MZH7_9ASPA